jgi:isoleucyl-tRNA synthetase
MNSIIKNRLFFAKKLQEEIDKWEKTIGFSAPEESDLPSTIRYNSHLQFKINEALEQISGELSYSYIQIYKDLQDSERVSWSGTAHEIREVLTNLLRLLAPDEKVTSESWYQQVKNTSGPTQKHRVKYILLNRSAGSKERAVVKQVTKLDEMIEDLVRSTYKRASDAAHRHKTKSEVSRILRYFETFAIDLLNIEI